MKYLNTDQTAEMLSVHPETVRRLIKGGVLPALRIGNSYRINPDDLDRLSAEADVPVGHDAALRGSSLKVA